MLSSGNQVFSPSFTADDPWPTNDWFNGLLRAARRNRIASVGPGLVKQGGALSARKSPDIWAKLAGTGPGYGFAEAIPNTSGGFDLLSGGRSDVGGHQPAYEANAATGLANTYQRLKFSTAGDWRFEDRRGGSSGSGGGGGGGGPNCGDCTYTLDPCTISVVFQGIGPMYSDESGPCPTTITVTKSFTYGSYHAFGPAIPGQPFNNTTGWHSDWFVMPSCFFTGGCYARFIGDPCTPILQYAGDSLGTTSCSRFDTPGDHRDSLFCGCTAVTVTCSPFTVSWSNAGCPGGLCNGVRSGVLTQ